MNELSINAYVQFMPVPKSEFQNQKKNQQLRISQAQHRILLLQKYFN